MCMFSGIVQGVSEVSSVIIKSNFKTFSIDMGDELAHGLEVGASVAIDGVCMTTVKINENIVYFDAMKETLEKTTIGSLESGDLVNIERALRLGDEIGGHYVSGHVHGKVRIEEIDESFENNLIITFKVPEYLTKYIFDKGFVTLNGVSLTIVNVNYDFNKFKVSFIPETLRNTNFSKKTLLDYINLEIDQHTLSIVETVDNYLLRLHK